MLTKLTNEISDNDLLRHVIALNNETEGLKDLKELADCREITKVNSSSQGIINCAEHEIKKHGSKLAILVPQKSSYVFVMARAYQIFSDEYRESVNVFSSIDEALIWLTNDNEAEIETLTLLINSA